MNNKTAISVATPRGRHTLHIERKDTANSLADNLGQHGVPLNTRCGQKGICKGCIVNLTGGQVKDDKKIVTAPVELKSCSHNLIAGETVSLEVPARSLLIYTPHVMKDFKIGIPSAHQPIIGDNGELGKLGFAVDVGTTTVVVILVDLLTGKILAEASDFNRQIHYGDDVLTRIQLCSTDPAMVKTLQDAIVRQTILPLADEVCDRAGVSLDETIDAMTVVGNTIMLHLLKGEDPSSMGYVPFTPLFLEHLLVHSSEIGLYSNDNKPKEDSSIKRNFNMDVHLLPGLAAYVGADLTAGVYTTGMLYDEGPSLLIDVGTNGEIIFKHGDTLLGCATAAGPAFEGSRLTCGMRAVENVISHIRLNELPEKINYDMIKGEGSAHIPSGICGSAYVDFLAEARRIGLINQAGRFDEEYIRSLSPDFILSAEYGRAFSLTPKNKNNPIVISEADIASLLQAKAAIAAGMLTLLAQTNLNPYKVKKLYLAGGFGFHLDIENAITCGLFPDFHPEQIEVVGNTALGGAYLSLLDRNAIDEMEEIRQKITIIELNLDPHFEDRYIDNLSLP